MKRNLIHSLLILVVVIALSACTAIGPKADPPLAASGTIEADTVRVSSEMGGRIMAISVDKGDSVKSGAVVFHLDDTLLQAQRSQAAANLEASKANSVAAQSAVQLAQADLSAAQLNFDTAKSTEAAQRQLNISSATLALLQAQNALTDLLQNAGTVTANAQVTLVKAQKAYSDTLQAHDNLNDLANSEAANNAREALVNAQGLVNQLRNYYNSLPGDPQTNPAKAQIAFKLKMARIQLEIIHQKVDLYGGEPSTYDLNNVDANLALAQAMVDLSQTKLDEVKNGPSAEDLAMAKERVANAQAALDLANAQPATQQVDLAQDALNAAQARLSAANAQATAAMAQVGVAQAALDSLDVQISKLSITAPTSGVVLDRPLNVGEMATPGATLIEIGNLDTVKLTVYIPEDQYGRIQLGQKATIQVDSFPGKTFDGTVYYISDQAEFTPRNVQTVESRSTTVYAIQISISNPDHQLKPGMPADATF